MSAYSAAKTSKLLFKGEKKAKSQKKRKSVNTNKETQVEQVLEGWIPVLSLSDLEGPLLILTTGKEVEALTLKTNKSSYSETGQITRETVYLDFSATDSLESVSVIRYEPKSVEQVFVGQRVFLKNAITPKVQNDDSDSEKEAEDSRNSKETLHGERVTQPDSTTNPRDDANDVQFVFKTCRDAYVSLGVGGTVEAESAAISSNELWTPVLAGGDSGLVSFYATAGSHSNTKSSSADRRFLCTLSQRTSGSRVAAQPGEIESIGDTQVFRVFCQAEIRHQRQAAIAAQTANKSVTTASLAHDELERIKKFQSWKHGRVRTDTVRDTMDSKELKKARTQGKYHEELLDRRSKLKADKFCNASTIRASTIRASTIRDSVLFSDSIFDCNNDSDTQYDSYKTVVQDNYPDIPCLKQTRKTWSEHNRKRKCSIASNECSGSSSSLSCIYDLETNNFPLKDCSNSFLSIDTSDNNSNSDFFSANDYEQIDTDFIYDSSSSDSDPGDFNYDTTITPHPVKHAGGSLHELYTSNKQSTLNMQTFENEHKYLDKPKHENNYCHKISLNVPNSQLQILFNSDECDSINISYFDSYNARSANYILDAIYYISRKILQGKIHSYIYPDQNHSNKACNFSELLRAAKKGLQRDVFYKNLNCFASQRQVDLVCQDLETYFQVLPRDLHLLASPNGFIAGPIKALLKNGQTIDYMLDTIQGMLIPDYTNISSIQPSHTLKYVLIVEKETVFYSLLQSQLVASREMLLITGKGYPSHNTRGFLCTLYGFINHSNIYQNNQQSNSDIKWLVLTDNDPHGAHIFETYHKSSPYASKSVSFMPICSFISNTRNYYYLPLYWIGLHSEDRSRYRSILLDDTRMPVLNKTSRLKCHQLIESWSSFENPRYQRWRIQMSKLLYCGKKAELESLSNTKNKSILLKFLFEKLENPSFWL
ncbi:hypothetical protein BB561_000396 [Smittium simulii]|uniref:DNA topoisomerase (ATP-hydrolyzing) n=1 Tax=Smittium simulii TaxID=133385 RepID=A0A2T9YZG8_9FUNG|nr:hypothetical protein BB561_000396 [Smittium simulii]